MTTDATTEKSAADKTAAWDALLLELRQLVELAERARDTTTANADDLTAPEVLAELRLTHERLDESGRAVMPLVAACRRGTYKALRGDEKPWRMTYEEIAEAFGLGSHQAIGNVLAGRRSKSKRRRLADPAPDAGADQ